MSKNSSKDRVSIIQAVKTPLGFFVLIALIAETFFGTVAFKAQQHQELYVGIAALVLIVLVAVVAILATRGRGILLGQATDEFSADQFTIYIGPPDDLRNLDVTRIEWDDAECFVQAGNVRELVKLVPSRQGGSFTVELGEKARTQIQKNQSMEFTLKDRKGNKWSVRPFYLLETLVHLHTGENRRKVIEDYSEQY